MATRGGRMIRRLGATMVEFALVGSIFLLFLFGVLEYCRLLMVRQVLNNAAREGARYAVVHTYDKETVDIQNWVMTYLAGQDKQLAGFTKESNIKVFWADPTTGNNLGDWKQAGFGQAIAVEIMGEYVPITPTLLFMPNSVSLTARCIMLSEAN